MMDAISLWLGERLLIGSIQGAGLLNDFSQDDELIFVLHTFSE